MNDENLKKGHGQKRALKEDRAIAALITESSIEEAAKKAGISVSSMWRWKKDPDFNKKYMDARRQVLAQATAQLQNNSSSAVGVLCDIMEDKECPPTVRVSAAKTIIELAYKGMEIEDLGVRIEALELASGAGK